MKKNQNNSKKEKAGMYVALSLCLAAIVIAAWGTLSSLTDFVSNNIDTEESSESSNNDVDPENSASEISKSESSVLEESSIESNAEKGETNEENPVDDQVNTVPYTLASNFSYPVESHVALNEYNANTLVYNEILKDYRLHLGVDLPASMGETVYSSNSGVVKKCGFDVLLGNYIVIQHGDYEFWYCGLTNEMLVDEGDIVPTKAKIGTIQNVPFESTTSHLHLEVIYQGKRIDPLSLRFSND